MVPQIYTVAYDKSGYAVVLREESEPELPFRKRPPFSNRPQLHAIDSTSQS
jgi:hypothetical protein